MNSFLKFSRLFLVLSVFCFFGLMRAWAAVPCPACTEIDAQIKTQKVVLKDWENKIKDLQAVEKAKNAAEKAQKEAAKLAALEQLKQKDPKKYAESIAKQNQKAAEIKTPQAPQAPKAPQVKLSQEELLARMKEKDPAMYALVVPRNQVRDQLKTLSEQRKNCAASCQKVK